MTRSAILPSNTRRSSVGHASSQDAPDGPRKRDQEADTVPAVMKRILFLLLVIAGAFTTTASAAHSGTRLQIAPTAVTAGQPVLVAATVRPPGARCSGA